MTRHEIFDCIRDLIHRFTGHPEDFQTSHPPGQDSQLFDEFGGATSTFPEYPNPFDEEAPRQLPTNPALEPSAGVQVTGHSGIGRSDI